MARHIEKPRPEFPPVTSAVFPGRDHSTLNDMYMGVPCMLVTTGSKEQPLLIPTMKSNNE